MKTAFNFTVATETNEHTGEIMAVYLGIRNGQVAKTVEHANGNLLADYDRKGRLLGVEILAPCRAQVFAKIAVTQKERQFLKGSIPNGMLLTA